MSFHQQHGLKKKPSPTHLKLVDKKGCKKTWTFKTMFQSRSCSGLLMVRIRKCSKTVNLHFKQLYRSMKVTCWCIPHQRDSESVPVPGHSHCRPLYSEATLRLASDWSLSLHTGLWLVTRGWVPLVEHITGVSAVASDRGLQSSSRHETSTQGQSNATKLTSSDHQQPSQVSGIYFLINHKVVKFV